jgi:hypothetical protein
MGDTSWSHEWKLVKLVSKSDLHLDWKEIPWNGKATHRQAPTCHGFINLWHPKNMRDNNAGGLYIPDEQVVSGLMSGWWVLDSFVFKTSAHSLATHWVCTTHLHHCLSNPTVLWLLCQLLLGWNTHKWKFLTTSQFVNERQWCRWLVHTLWAGSEWADQWVTNLWLLCI